MPVTRLLRFAGLAIGGVAVIGAVAIFVWLEGTLPDYERALFSDDLGAPVTITRDAFGIPHIEAQSFDDAAFALGYAQAQDRLWQMEIMRRAVLGRTAEVMGEAFLPIDVNYRIRFSSAEVWRKSYERLSPDMKRTFAAFAAGVNLAIEEGQGARSPEWAVLGIEPEPWSAADVNNLMTLVMDLATGGGHELDIALHSTIFSDDELDLLYEPLADCFPTTYEDINPGEPALLKSVGDCVSAENASIGVSDPALGNFGTNLFVVAPALTSTGAPILAVDPHLPAQAPGAVYPVVIELPEDVIAGGAWIGSPAVAFGHNSRIAWGMTHLYVDTTDYVVEKINPDNADEYMTPDGPKPFTIREETFLIKNKPSRTVRVRETRNGVVVSDAHLYEDADAAEFSGALAPKFSVIADIYGPGHVVAMKQAVATDGQLTLQSTVRASRAHNWEEFRTALQDYESTNNLVYADVDGNIGLQMAAKIPLRRQVNGWNGQRLARGWLGEGEWDGYVSFNELASVYNPPKGWIADSNSRAVGSAFPHRVADFYSPPWRIMRSSELVAAQSDHDVESIARIQMDVYSVKADWLLDRLARFKMTSERARDAMRLLQQWDRTMDKDRPEPLLYAAFELALQQRLVNARHESVAGTNANVLLLARIVEREHPWCDDPDTPTAESCAAAVNDALDAAIDWVSRTHGDDMKKWRWGAVHVAEFPAFYSWNGVPVLGGLTKVSVPVGGSDATLSAAASARPAETADDLLAGDIDFKVDHVAPFRMVADLSDFSNSRYTFAPGVSGNSYSPHWDDLTVSWAAGEPFQLYGRSNDKARVTEISPNAHAP